MKIEWNWGTKLLIWIIVFMLFIFVMVYLTTQNSIMLVEKDYYPKGLQFQTRIDERENAKKWIDSVQVIQESSHVVVHFPEINPDTGTVMFYRFNNNLLDQTIQIEIDENGRMIFPVKKFARGKYLVKIHWFENDQGYYIEKPFNFR